MSHLITKQEHLPKQKRICFDMNQQGVNSYEQS